MIHKIIKNSWDIRVKKAAIASLCAISLLTLAPVNRAPLYAFQTRKSMSAHQKIYKLYKHLISKDTNIPGEQRQISLNMNEVPLLSALKILRKKTDVVISYQNDAIPDENVTEHFKKASVNQILGKLLRGTNLEVVLMNSNDALVIRKKQSKEAIQTGTVTGTVIDANSSNPLPGVNIAVKGTKMGTSTNNQGHYELEVPSLQEDTLVFSFIGYETQRIPINGREEINVSLSSAMLTGNQVVVTGYSKQRKSDVTGAVDIASVENLQLTSPEIVTKGLQGQVSGVSINSSGQPGDQPQINIRGFNSFGNNQPLFVVDGVPTQDISFLNPHNIQSLQVLKDAGAASQYGARASNGVVVVSTKQGEGDVRVTYNTSFGYQFPGSDDPYDILSPLEQGQLEWKALKNSGMKTSHPIWGNGNEPSVPEWILPARANNPNTGDYYVVPEYKDPDLLSQFNQFVRARQEGTNWYDALTDPAPLTKQNINVGGGGDFGNYFTSFSYTNKQGTVLNTYLKRYTARINTNFNVSDNIRIGENLVYDVSNNLQAGTQSGRNALGFVYNMHSIIPVRDIRGNFAGTQAPGLGTAQNPVALRDRTKNDGQQTRRLFGNAFAEIDFLKSFTFRTSAGIDLRSGYLETFQFPTYEQSQNITTNKFTKETSSVRNWDWTNQINFNHTFGNYNNVSAVLAVEAIRNTNGLDQISRTDYFSFDKNYVQLATGSGTPSVDVSNEAANTLLSYIMNIGYNYNRTYLLSFTLRRDGSSKFINDQWRWFPALTAGWRISELSLLKDVSWLTNLKVRGGYGVMGNQFNASPDNGYTLYGGTPQTTYYPIAGGNDIRQGIRQVRIGNPNAQWERDKNLNIGVDFSIFNGHLGGSVDYYQKNIDGLLYNPALPATAGAAAPPSRNVASMRNRGWDLSLRGQTNFTEDLSLTGQLNFTSFNNEIRSIAPGVGKFDVGVVRNEVGYPISSFFGYDIVGFWQSPEEVQQANAKASDGIYEQDAAPGRFRYRDANGDNEITPADRVHLGSPHPDFSYGLNLQITYRNWNFSTFLYGEQGKQLWNQTKNGTDFRGTFNTATSKVTLYDSWSKDNRDAEVPIQEINQYFSTSGANTSYYIENASYLRIKNLQLGYKLPSSVLQQISINNLRVYIQARNLVTFTPYSGLNPDIGATESAINAAEASGGRVKTGATNFGVDRGGYPVSKVFEGGLSLSF